MRIEPTGKTPAAGLASPGHPETGAPATPERADHVELSRLSRAVASLTSDRLDEIQSAVRSEAYQVNARELSHSIIDFYLIPAN
jgi:hypothetical protein